jgi:hypothetical protein
MAALAAAGSASSSMRDSCVVALSTQLDTVGRQRGQVVLCRLPFRVVPREWVDQFVLRRYELVDAVSLQGGDDVLVGNAYAWIARLFS